jgi:ABC-type Mn2+/Zn2+ transport system ATPase subunit
LEVFKINSTKHNSTNKSTHNTEPEELIKFDHVNIGFNNKAILEDINLTINKGAYVGIIGPNGSGKTTFLKTLLGLIEPQSGIISIKGNPINREIKNDIGYVPQSIKIEREFPLTVSEAVMMGRYSQIGLFKRPNKEDKKAVDFALHQVHMHSYRKRPIGHLSGGEQQKVLIARALAKKPEILLMDEPTSALDFQMTLSVFELIKELNEKYAYTIIMVHHNVTLIRSKAHRLLVFDGAIRYDGNPKLPDADEIIKLAYNIAI